jgi:hypothetical protein
MQSNYGLFPPGKLAHTLPESFLFPVSVLGSHTFNADVEQFFDRRPDLVLGGDRVYLESISIVSSALVRSLLGNERPQNHLVRPEVEARIAMNAWLAASQLPHVGFRVWS